MKWGVSTVECPAEIPHISAMKVGSASCAVRLPSSASDSGGTVRAAPGTRAACLRTAPQMDIWRRVRIPHGAHPGDCQVGSAPGPGWNVRWGAGKWGVSTVECSF